MVHIYRRKPIEIMAVRFNGSSTHAKQIEDWMTGGEAPPEDGVHTRDIRPLRVQTDFGTVEAKAGDWILRSVEGEYYPCPNDTFERTYERVE